MVCANCQPIDYRVIMVFMSARRKFTIHVDEVTAIDNYSSLYGLHVPPCVLACGVVVGN